MNYTLPSWTGGRSTPFVSADRNTYSADRKIKYIKYDKDPGKSEVICPYCGKKVFVGQLSYKDNFVGHCDQPFVGGCFWYPFSGLNDLSDKLKEIDYDFYLSGKWYRYGFNPNIDSDLYSYFSIEGGDIHENNL